MKSKNELRRPKKLRGTTFQVNANVTDSWGVNDTVVRIPQGIRLRRAMRVARRLIGKPFWTVPFAHRIENGYFPVDIPIVAATVAWMTADGQIYYEERVAA